MSHSSTVALQCFVELSVEVAFTYSFICCCPLKQQYPTFLAPEIGFMEDNFFHRPGDGWGMVSGRFKHITLIVCFISFIISSAPPRSPDIRSQGWVFLL